MLQTRMKDSLLDISRFQDEVLLEDKVKDATCLSCGQSEGVFWGGGAI